MHQLPQLRVVARRRLCLCIALHLALLLSVLSWDGRSAAQSGQQVQPIVAVSAASFIANAPVSPGSIVAVFTGGVLRPGTVLNGTDADAIPTTPEFDLPLLLGNLTVEVHGRSAGIFGIFGQSGFDQFNILIPSDLLPGRGPILIKDATGLILAAGEIEIAPVAPAIFTANVGGRGLAAAYILRVLASGEQRIEPVAVFNPATGQFVPRPIDLSRSDELVFLVLFLTGGRGIAVENETRVLLGGIPYTPIYVGPAPGFLGLEQINLRLPRSLPAGLLQLTFIHLKDGRSANPCEIVIAPPAGAPPRVTGLSKAEVLAGETIEVIGTGFTPDSEVIISDATGKLYNAQIMETSATSMKVRIPFGSGTGILMVRNSSGEVGHPLRMRTSMSGVVQRAEAQPDGSSQLVGIRNVTIRMRQNDVDRTTMTNDDGAFLMPDVIPTSRLTFEVDGTTNGALPLPKDVRSIRIDPVRDNKYEGYIELKAITGPSAPVAEDGRLTSVLTAIQQPGRDAADQLGTIVFDPQGSVIRFPDGTTVNNLTVTALDAGRVPANLPPNQFSSTIAQLTPIGATLNPGGKLSFPNTDAYTQSDALVLYRFDQTPGSPTRGDFVVAGQGFLSADGQRVETASNAIKESTYYFISKTRRVTTIYGRVEEEIGGGAMQPARGALVQVRGQSITNHTDETGTFSLGNVPIPEAATLANGFAIEVSFLRGDGTVDRAERVRVLPGLSGLTFVDPPIILVNRGRSRAPVIQAPKSLTVEAGKQAEFSFIAYARTVGQNVTNVQVFGPAFASVASLGGDRYALRLAPTANDVGSYTLELRATDSRGERTSETVLLEVKAAQQSVPIALSRSIETTEDQPVNVVLTGTGGDRFRVVSDPRRGRLSGVAPNLVFTPETDFTGTDSFSFVVGNGTVESAPAVVTINVRPVSDGPQLTVGDLFTTNIGQRLAIVINAYDGDAGQKLTLSATGLPMGAAIQQTTATSFVLEWRPTSAQVGVYQINLTLSDDGTPMQSTAKTITIVVDAAWTPGVILSADKVIINSIVVLDGVIIAGTFSGGIYRSLDNGVTWSEANSGLPSNSARFVQSLTVSGRTIIAGTAGGVGGGIYRSLDNGATWTDASSGLPSGNARSVQSLIVSSGTIIAGTAGGGIYRSLDNGATWGEANSGLPSGEARNVFSLTASSAGIFAGTGGAGIYRSLDNGATWTESNTGLPSGEARSVRSLAASSAGIFAGTGGAGIYRSLDNGATWTESNSGILGGSARFVRSLAASSGAIIAGTGGGGIYRSLNNGATWSEANSGLSGSARNIFSLTVGSGAIFAGTGGAGIYRSFDNGVTWSDASSGLPAGSSSIVRSLAVSSGTIIAGTQGGGIYRSLDNGATWSEANSGLPSGNARSVFSLIVSSGTIIAGTQGGGIYRSLDNGMTWSEANTGLPSGNSRNVFSLTVSSGTIIAGTNGAGIYLSPDNGATWSEANSGLAVGAARSVRSLAASSVGIFAGTNGAGIYRSFDNGATWSEANSGLPVGAGRNVFSLTVSGTTVFAGTNGAGIYRSFDNGATWSEASSGLPVGAGRNVFSLTVSGTTVFAGTSGVGTFTLAESAIVWEPRSNGLSSLGVNAAILDGDAVLVGTFDGGAFRTLDEGLNWASANAGLPPNARVQAFTRTSAGTFAGILGAGVYFTADRGATWAARSNGLANLRVKALASDSATIWAGTEAGVFRSTDQGNNWAAASTGLTDQRVLSLAVSGNVLYAGTENGLFRSNNGGGSWTAINSGLGNLYILSIGIAPDGNTVLAGTTNGLYRSTNTGTSWVLVNNGIPAQAVPLAFAVSGNKLLAGTFSGYYISENNGSSWRPSNTGLVSLQVGALAVKGNQVFAGTRGRGVFISRLE